MDGYFMDEWLGPFAYHNDMDVFVYLLAVIIALVTVSTQTIKAAMRNPANTLRYDQIEIIPRHQATVIATRWLLYDRERQMAYTLLPWVKRNETYVASGCLKKRTINL